MDLWTIEGNIPALMILPRRSDRHGEHQVRSRPMRRSVPLHAPDGAILRRASGVGGHSSPATLIKVKGMPQTLLISEISTRYGIAPCAWRSPPLEECGKNGRLFIPPIATRTRLATPGAHWFSKALILVRPGGQNWMVCSPMQGFDFCKMLLLVT